MIIVKHRLSAAKVAIIFDSMIILIQMLTIFTLSIIQRYELLIMIKIIHFLTTLFGCMIIIIYLCPRKSVPSAP